MTDWTISQDERHDMVARMADNIGRMAFFRGTPLLEDLCDRLAASIESQSYSYAQAQSKTTSGARPAIEVTRIYAQKLGEFTLKALKGGATMADAAAASAPLSLSLGGAVLDLSGGEREFLTTETAEKALAPMLVDKPVVTKIRFSQKSFGVDAANVAKRAISHCANTLIDADISDVIAGRPESEALASLTILSEGLASCRLRSLNLSDNALGEKGLRACSPALTTQTLLASLSLENVGCSVHACKALGELLPNPDALRRLNLFNNMSGDEGATHIASVLARAKHMEDFRMVYSRVGGPGGIALSKALSVGHALVRLDLSGNPMTPAYAHDLGEALKAQRQLKYLNLNDTLLEDKGVEVIAAALGRAAPYLEELELATNEITSNGASAMAKCLIGKPGLVRLNLRENELKDKGVCLIVAALANNDSLKSLDLYENQVRGKGALEAAKHCAARQDFEKLDLDGNWLTEDVITQVEGMFKAVGSKALTGFEDNDEEGFDESDEEDEVDLDMSKAKI